MRPGEVFPAFRLDPVSQTVTLKPCHRPPEVDERLPDESLEEEQKRRHVSDCQRYVGQLKWLATRTRPDISAALGICASMMVRTRKVVAAHLVHLWRYVWTTRLLTMSTLAPAKSFDADCPQSLQGPIHGSKMSPRIRKEGQSDAGRGVPKSKPVFQIHACADASFLTSGGRS